MGFPAGKGEGEREGRRKSRISLGQKMKFGFPELNEPLQTGKSNPGE